MVRINPTILGVAIGMAGAAFIGWCVYFDKKRTSDPEYKKKLRERRRRSRLSAGNQGGIPNLKSHEGIERYFLQEIQLGETLIARGNFEAGVIHLANAIVVCGQPARLLQVLQTSLPVQVFAMLIFKMQELGDRVSKSESGTPYLRFQGTAIDSEGISSVGNVDDLE